MEDRPTVSEWLNTAVSGIRFGPDQEEVRAEPKSQPVPEEMGVWDGHPLHEVTDRDIYARDPWDNSAWAQMTAVFYSETGAELGRAVLNTPEGGEKRAD